MVITARERDAVVEALLAPRYNYGVPRIVIQAVLNDTLCLEHLDRATTFLDRQYANNTLRYIAEIWKHPVHLPPMTRTAARQPSRPGSTPKQRTGGIMLRKHLLTDHPAERVAEPEEKDIAALATVWVTSETADHPIDNAFDSHRGPGGSRWVAGEPGPQRLLLAFDAPQTLHMLRLEVEERDVSRTQELHVAISRDGGHAYQTLLRQGVYLQSARHDV